MCNFCCNFAAFYGQEADLSYRHMACCYCSLRFSGVENSDLRGLRGIRRMSAENGRATMVGYRALRGADARKHGSRSLAMDDAHERRRE